MRANIKYAAFLFLLSISTLFVTCNSKNSTETQLPDLWPPLDTDTTMSYNKAVRALYGADCIEGPFVGLGARESRLYKSYKWLSGNAYDSSLIILASNTNPYTRTYAFMALCERKSTAVTNLLNRYIKDTTDIKSLSGCIGAICPLNTVWLSVAKPTVNSELYNSLQKIVILSGGDSTCIDW
jgi:hypothetical protein